MKPALKRFVRSTTTRLATTYLAIIMLMSIGFSIVFYNASIHELSRQVPPRDAIFGNTQHRDDSGTPGQDQGFVVQIESGSGVSTATTNTSVHDYLLKRADEARKALLIRLILLNVTALLAGGLLSWYLARRTLEPIERAMSAQSQFISDASHELRTPLTAIRTSNDVSLRNPKLTLAQAKQVIRANTEEAAKLQLLSDGLLNLAKNGTVHQKLSPVSLQAAVSEAINKVIPLAQEKQIAINDDAIPPVTVMSDQQLLGQILVILLDNALKYSNKNTAVTLSAAKKGNHTYIHIADEGIGIRASDLPHVFRRFYRADTSRTRSAAHGYGLGLAIATTLADATDASLSARSEPGRGSVFTIKARSASHDTKRGVKRPH